jgi:CelD/BcsL family acetyltransferase involved in cellulose biosynthesis
VEPLSTPGLEEDVAVAIATALSELDDPPAVVNLQVCDDGVDWAALIAGAWPGRGAWAKVEKSVPVPTIEIGEGGFEAWFDAKSSSFRREARRKQKRLDKAGASFRFADEETLERDVAEFLRLHRARLTGQGGSSLDDERIGPMLVEVGRELLPEGRFRILCLEVDGTAVAAQILLCAGSEASAWNSGFDEGYADLSPSVQCILEALRDACDRGEATMSLGPGDQPYKARLATGTHNLVSQVLVPRRRGSARVRGRILTRSAWRAAGAYARRARSLSPRQAWAARG